MMDVIIAIGVFYVVVKLLKGVFGRSQRRITEETVSIKNAVQPIWVLSYKYMFKFSLISCFNKGGSFHVRCPKEANLYIVKRATIKDTDNGRR